jgi:hypothetical protein
MTSLPTTRGLALAYRISLLVGALTTAVSVVSVFDPARVYPGLEPALLPLFVGQDALNVIVALPALLGSMWLARRGALIGLLLWPGALFYVVYDFGYYALGAPFNAFFVPYLLLIALSVYALVGVVASIDAPAVRAQLRASVPARVVGGFLVGLAALFTLLWTGMSIAALASGETLPLVPRIVTTLDLTIELPALFVGGLLLVRRQPLGYIVAAGLLLQAGAYLAGLSVITVLTQVVTHAPSEALAVVPGFVVGVISFALIGPFIHGAAHVRRAQAPTPTLTDPTPDMRGA